MPWQSLKNLPFSHLATRKPEFPTKELHGWIRPDDYPPTQSYYALALDIDSSTPTVANAVSFEMVNFFNRNVGGNRWDATVLGYIGPVDGTEWVTNAYAFRVLSTGINNNPVFANGDAGFDSRSACFYVGSLAFEANAPGLTGLYFRTGSFLSVLAGGINVPAPLQYGGNVVTPPYAGNVAGTGDPITPDLALADAIIRVNVPEPSAWVILVSTGLIVVRNPKGRT